jgi:hypothetical protein
MKIVEGCEEEYRTWRENNKDPYGNACFDLRGSWGSIHPDKGVKKRGIR